MLGNKLRVPSLAFLISESRSELKEVASFRVEVLVETHAKFIAYGILPCWERNIEYKFEVFVVNLLIFLRREMIEFLSDQMSYEV